MSLRRSVIRKNNWLPAPDEVETADQFLSLPEKDSLRSGECRMIRLAGKTRQIDLGRPTITLMKPFQLELYAPGRSQERQFDSRFPSDLDRRDIDIQVSV